MTETLVDFSDKAGLCELSFEAKGSPSIVRDICAKVEWALVPWSDALTSMS